MRTADVCHNHLRTLYHVPLIPSLKHLCSDRHARTIRSRHHAVHGGATKRRRTMILLGHRRRGDNSDSTRDLRERLTPTCVPSDITSRSPSRSWLSRTCLRFTMAVRCVRTKTSGARRVRAMQVTHEVVAPGGMCRHAVLRFDQTISSARSTIVRSPCLIDSRWRYCADSDASRPSADWSSAATPAI